MRILNTKNYQPKQNFQSRDLYIKTSYSGYNVFWGHEIGDAFLDSGFQGKEVFHKIRLIHANEARVLWEWTMQNLVAARLFFHSFNKTVKLARTTDGAPVWFHATKQ